jgi:hypothetical protein
VYIKGLDIDVKRQKQDGLAPGQVFNAVPSPPFSAAA